MTISEEYFDVICDAIDTYGRNAQTDMCIEECSELIKALLKFRRLTIEERLAAKGMKVLGNIQEEIADVQIMLWQMELLYGYGCEDGEIERKIDRLKERVKTVGKLHQEAKESICRKCWCNTCTKLLDGCDAFPPSPDGSRPLPCAECRAKDCAPLMPKVHPAECGTYESVPEDCAACWCSECSNFEQCRVSKAGYDPDAGLCPCVGCEPGMIYMPQETPPTCGQFQARFER